MAEHQVDAPTGNSETAPPAAVTVVANVATDHPTLTTATTPTYAANAVATEEATPTAYLITMGVTPGDGDLLSPRFNGDRKTDAEEWLQDIFVDSSIIWRSGKCPVATLWSCCAMDNLQRRTQVTGRRATGYGLQRDRPPFPEKFRCERWVQHRAPDEVPEPATGLRRTHAYRGDGEPALITHRRMAIGQNRRTSATPEKRTSLACGA